MPSSVKRGSDTFTFEMMGDFGYIVHAFEISNLHEG